MFFIYLLIALVAAVVAWFFVKAGNYKDQQESDASWPFPKDKP